MSKSQIVTPPRSSALLSPPSTGSRPSTKLATVYAFILNSASRLYPISQLVEFPLNLADFDEFLSRAENDQEFRANLEKRRYNYQDGVISFPMPSTIHENLIAQFRSAINHQLSTLKNGNGADVAFTQAFHDRSHENVILYDDHGKRQVRSPDVVFRFDYAQYPGLVGEVAVSQPFRQADRLAEEYILNSDGNIRAVVIFKICKRNSKEATVSLWVPCLEEDEKTGQMRLSALEKVKNKIFRNSDGAPVDDSIIELPLKDLALRSIVPNINDMEGVLMIPLNLLAQCLNKVEEESREMEAGRGAREILPPETKKRRRHYTPEDKLRSEDEEEDEKRVKRICDDRSENDSDYNE